MKTYSKLLALAIMSTAAAVNAQTYGEIGYTATTYKENANGNGIKASPAAIRGLIGYELNPNLAIEGMVALGLGDSTVKVNGQNISSIKLEIDNAIGLYLKPKTKLNDSVEIFGRVGFARIKGTVTATGYGTETASDNGFSYGAGLSYAINPSTSLNADYMSYLNKDGSKVNGFNLGVGFKF
jgi:outer membrane autotransporter protein